MTSLTVSKYFTNCGA